MTTTNTQPDALRRLVDEQAEDDGLWFEARTAPEAYLQAALRKLHAEVEKLRQGGEAVACALCGEERAFTGTCGGGRNNPKALCYTSPPLQADDCKVPQAALDFDQFLNEPPSDESNRTVREFRHDAYPRWIKALESLRPMLSAAPTQEDKGTWTPQEEARLDAAIQKHYAAAPTQVETQAVTNECRYPMCSCIVSLDGSWSGCRAAPSTPPTC